MATDSSSRVVVLGSGVVGLTCALVLAEQGHSVRVVGRDLPSDTASTAFASPWAGATWFPYTIDPHICRWEAATFKRFKMLQRTHPALIMTLPMVRYATTEEGLLKHWYRSLVPRYREMPAPSTCPSTTKAAAFDSFSVNAPQYLLWLQGELAARGVRVDRREVGSLDEAFACYEGAAVVVNATGLGAGTLKGVEDALVEPIRGQTLLVYAPNVTASIMDSSSDAESFYLIPRPGGEVILGGCYDTGSWDTTVDHALARRILERCYKLDPRLSDGQGVDAVKIIRHNVGLRPSRRGGPRLEAESLSRGRRVIHAYGNGPGGYQGSWGIADEVASLVGGGSSDAKSKP